MHSDHRTGTAQAGASPGLRLRALLPRVHRGAADRLIAVVADTMRRLPRTAILGSVAINLLSLVMPLATLQVYDRIIPNAASETLLLLLSGVIAVICVEHVLRTARANLITTTATRLAWQVHDEAIARILSAPKRYVDEEPPSRILERLQAMASVAEWQASPSRLVLVDLPFVPIYLAVLALVGGWLVLVPILLFAGLGAAGAARAFRLRKVVEERSASDARIRDFLIESIGGVTTIKALAMEPQMLRRFERLQESAAERNYETTSIADAAQSFALLSSSLTQVLTVAIGGTAAALGAISVGTLACCTMLAGWSVQPVLRAVGLLAEIENLSVAEAKARPLMDLPAARPVAHPLPDERVPVEVRFEGVVLQRQREGAATLDIPAFTIERGEIVAVSGPDGCGKSSLVGLVSGELEPAVGRVLVDGTVAHEANSELAARVACVTQRQAIVRGSLLDNLTMFRTGSSIEAALEASRLIGLDADINALPTGYDLRVADGLVEQLPAGMLQRVAIARAISRRPGLLVLDEANSALDMNADRALLEGLRKLRGSTTILLVTNRPSTAAVADRHFTIVEGRLVPKVPAMAPAGAEARTA